MILNFKMKNYYCNELIWKIGFIDKLQRVYIIFGWINGICNWVVRNLRSICLGNINITAMNLIWI